MMRDMHRFLLVLMLVALSFAPLLKGKVTKHFHPSKLYLPFPYRHEWKSAMPSPEILEILKGPFHFLDNGSQMYVFESADKKTVLKLFRSNRSKFPFIHALKASLHEKKKADLFTKLEKTLQAYALAFHQLPERTGLLYIHLNLTKNTLPTLEIQDPLGRKWHLPLDEYRFIVQKKAEPFKETFLLALQQGDDEGIKRAIDSFLEMLKERVRKGIRNSDHNLGPNFGFIEGQVVEIDCGNFHLDETLLEPEQQKKEIRRFSSQLGGWLGERSPQYADYLLARLDVDVDGL